MNGYKIELEPSLDGLLRAFAQDYIDAKNEENRLTERMVIAREREVANSERVMTATIASLDATVRYMEAQIKTLEGLKG